MDPEIEAVSAFIDAHPVDSHVWAVLAKHLLPLRRGPGWEALEARLDARWPDRLREWPQPWWDAPSAPDATALVRSAGHYASEFDPHIEAGIATFLRALDTHRPALTRLSLSGRWSAGQQEAVYGCLPQTLRKLMLWVDAVYVEELAAVTSLPALTALDLRPDAWTGQVAQVLELPVFDALRSLTLRFDTRPEPGQHARLVELLGRSGRTEQLDTLTLVYTSPAEWAALAALPWPRLARLRLIYCRASGDELTHLIAALPALQVVDWFDDRARPAALAAIPAPAEDEDTLDW
jgi:hypothetical protein